MGSTLDLLGYIAFQATAFSLMVLQRLEKNGLSDWLELEFQ